MHCIAGNTVPQGGIPGGEEPRSAIDPTALRGALHHTMELLSLQRGLEIPEMEGRAGSVSGDRLYSRLFASGA